MRFLLVIWTLVAISCQNKKEYLIQIPEETHLTSETILTELEKRFSENPEDNQLIRQQLYFCEQLSWPARCERVLVTAEERFGMSQKLLDQTIAYFIEHKDFDKVESLLQGQFETRERMEARIRIFQAKNDLDGPLTARYLAQYNDEKAILLGIEAYSRAKDTTNLVRQFQSLLDLDSGHIILKRYIPIVEKKRDYGLAISLIEKQLSLHANDSSLQIRRAKIYDRMGQRDTANYFLKELATVDAYALLNSWYIEEQQWDSSIFYLNKLIQKQPENMDWILAKASSLESKGWVTPSLPYYERALAADTSNLELKKQVEKVRRKVAYLRRKRELEGLVPPEITRKTRTINE